MKKNILMKVLTMIAAVAALTGCASQNAGDIPAIINDGTQVVETVGNGNADKTEKGVKATEDAGTGSGINSTAAEKGSAAPTAEEDAPEATTEPEATAEPEATTQPKATAEPEATTQPKATAKPKATAQPKTTAQPETTAEPEVAKQPETATEPSTTAQPQATAQPETTAEPEAAKQPETAAEPSTTAQPQTTTQPEPTPAPAPAQPPAVGDTTSACNHTFTIQTSTEVYSDCTGRALSVEACSKCGYVNKTIYDSGIVENHAYGEPIWAAYPTCSTPGEQYHICKNCGKEEAHYSTPAIADNHNYVAVSSSVVEAGCPNSQRLVDVTYVCSLCNASYSEWEIEVATEHPDSNGDGECDYCHCSVGTPVQQPESVPEQQPESVQQPEPAPEQQPVDNTQSGTE